MVIIPLIIILYEFNMIELIRMVLLPGNYVPSDNHGPFIQRARVLVGGVEIEYITWYIRRHETFNHLKSQEEKNADTCEGFDYDCFDIGEHIY